MAGRGKERKSHRDVRFVVGDGRGGFSIDDAVFEHQDKAIVHAFALAVDKGKAMLTVIVRSEAGARWLGAEDAVYLYRKDPRGAASAFERYKVVVHYV